MAGLKVERIKPGMENYPEQMLWNLWGFPDGSVVKNPPTNAGDMGLIPGSGRSPGGGNGKPLQSSCLGNPMDRGAWWTTIHGVLKNHD